jgi:uncharacterized protein (TIGR02996 family)
MRTFQYSDAKSHKFWNIEVTGKSFTVTYGRIGSAGQTQTKTFPNAQKAQAEADKLVAEKTKKGYVETTVTAAASEAEAFERAIRDNPDDVAAISAYADWLVEHDDPRGEFMQVQLALEDESRPKDERKKLQAREKALLKKHDKQWLGRLAPFVFAKVEPDDYCAARIEPRWRRGVLATVIVQRLTMALAQALADEPAVRCASELQVYDQCGGYYEGRESEQPRPRVKKPKGIDRHSELFELIGSPLLANLRRFQMGGEVPSDDGWCDCHTYVRGLEHVVAGMSRVEVLDLYCKDYSSGALFKLPNLTHLRELRVYHLGGRERQGVSPVYRLDVLADNPVLANLTHLMFHPHQGEDWDDNHPITYIPLEQVRALVRSRHLKKLTHLQLRLSDMGDEGVREIIASGILKQLKWLDLRHGCITDEGARLLAACPDAKNLEQLDLSRNGVTSKGLSALKKAGVKAVATQPLTGRELGNREYLYEGDGE